MLAVTTVPAVVAAAPAGPTEVEPAWLTKLQRAGTDETSAAIATHEGSTYVAATSVALDGSQEHGQPARDVAVTRLDTTGAELWSRRAGTGYLDDAVDVVAGAWGALVLATGAETVSGWDSTAGFSVTRYDPSGARTWTRWRDDADGASGLAVVGESYYVVGGSHVRRFDVATGDLLREHAGKVTEQVRATWSSVAALGDDLVVLGSSPVGADGDQYVLRRLDGQTLSVEWTKPFDVAQQDYPSDVVVADGRILLLRHVGRELPDRSRHLRSAPRRLRRGRRPVVAAHLPVRCPAWRAGAGRDTDGTCCLLHRLDHPRRPAGHDARDVQPRG